MSRTVYLSHGCRLSTPCSSVLGYRFDDGSLLIRALTHRSFGADHNERLEFLGDAVLSLAISSLLFERFAGSDEGDLTRVRAHLVREDSLHRVALSLGLPDVLRLSEGEARGGGAQRPSILADALEALIGATFLDGGFEPAQALVRRLFGEVIATTDIDSWTKDAKTELQEWLQARRLAGAGLPHRRDARPGARADLRGRMRRAGARRSSQHGRGPLAPRRRAGSGTPHARRAESERPARTARCGPELPSMNRPGHPDR